MLVRVEESTAHGRVLVATQDLDPGTQGLELLAEKPIMIGPKFQSETDQSPPMPTSLRGKMDPETWAFYHQYRLESKEIQQKVLEFHAELDWDKPNLFRMLLDLYSDFSEQQVEEFVLVSMIKNFNAVAMHPASSDGKDQGVNFGFALMELSGKMSHSCQPNCHWFTSVDGTQKIVRLITPVKKGEELTISYEPSDLIKPTYLRRKNLLQGRNFLCDCKRCQAPYDDSRRFYCSTRQGYQHEKGKAQKSKCLGVHFAVQPYESAEAVLLPCSECGHYLSDSEQQDLLDKESKLQETITYCNHVLDNGLHIDIQRDIMSLQALHPLHHQAAASAQLQSELFERHAGFLQVAKAKKDKIAVMHAILGCDYTCSDMAYAYDTVGDHLQRTACHNFEAMMAFQQAIRAYQISFGFFHPYTQAAVKNLMNIQNDCFFLQSQRGRCALCGLASTLKCSRCNGKAFYCSKDHQRVHWKGVHKKHCHLSI